MIDTIVDSVDLIGLVRLADLDFSEPVIESVLSGDGEVPLGDMMSALLDAGYPGFFELVGSVLERKGYEHAISRSLGFFSKSYSDLEVRIPDQQACTGR